ncbi:MAG: ankyrin repeat domain-containing protein, partial [Rhizobiales bacterium]|nr:ankyrin repeat domain-containing protein [Hyphomicrobiales bacterium]
ETIHDYAKRGDVAGIAAALDAGSDVNAYDGVGTPLTYAVRKGHFAAAELLIARGADVNISTMYYGEAIMLATRQSRVDLVELLLEHGAIPDSTLDGQPVLNLAVTNGCFGCVKALVEAGADVNWKTRDCQLTRSPLGIADFYGFREIAAYLKAHGARDSTWTAQR